MKDSWAYLAALAAVLEAAELGYQCVFRSDHFTNSEPPDQESLEAWVSLTYAATSTEAIEFGTLVSPVTFRHPAMLVRMAAAVDDLSGGRLVLGMGAGWQEREHHNFGVPFPDARPPRDAQGRTGNRGAAADQRHAGQLRRASIFRSTGRFCCRVRSGQAVRRS